MCSRRAAFLLRGRGESKRVFVGIVRIMDIFVREGACSAPPLPLAPL